MKVPSVVFKTRVRDNSIEGDNPFKWEDKTTEDYFKGKKVILFSLLQIFSHQLVLLFNYLILKNYIMILKKKVLMKYIV